MGFPQMEKVGAVITKANARYTLHICGTSFAGGQQLTVIINPSESPKFIRQIDVLTVHLCKCLATDS